MPQTDWNRIKKSPDMRRKEALVREILAEKPAAKAKGKGSKNA